MIAEVKGENGGESIVPVDALCGDNGAKLYLKNSYIFVISLSIHLTSKIPITLSKFNHIVCILLNATKPTTFYIYL